MKSLEKTKGRAGRPLSFDRASVLEKAMLVFWRHGYESSSLAELTEAMGITAPSLYAAFGDKKRLFLEAMQLYAGDSAAMQASIADAPSSLDAVRQVLQAAARKYTGKTTPRGCLLASAAASGPESSADVRAAIASVRRTLTASLRRRIARDVTDGLLPRRPTAKALADMVMAINHGMSVLARDGSTQTDLINVVEVALERWPNGPHVAST